MSPKEFYDKGPGEKKILQAFIYYEIKERNEENSQDGGD